MLCLRGAAMLSAATAAARQGDTHEAFSAYGARVTLTPPSASDVITLPGASPRAHSLQHLLRGI